MTNRRNDEIDVTVEEGSGNVFADLGLPDAGEMLVKADLVHKINEIIEERGLGQAEAARLIGARQPDISNLRRGRIRGYSTERLFRFLAALGQDVQITTRPAKRRDCEDTRGTVYVSP